MITKICNRCGREMPSTAEYFHSDKRNKDGLTGYCKACQSQYAKQYYITNKSKLLGSSARYYAENREERLLYSKKYTANGMERISWHRHRAATRSLPSTLNVEQWNEIKNKFDNRCAYCGLETKLEQDHFIPVSRGGGYTHQNVVPSCKSCNSRKGYKEFSSWYRTQSFYSEDREAFLLNHLNGQLSKETF